MGRTLNDGLARLQSESHIPARTWRQWCALLNLAPEDAVDVWDHICYPLNLATRRVPDIPFILQLRAARPAATIIGLREEVPRVLHLVGLINGLQDERLEARKAKVSVVSYYRFLASGPDGVLPSRAFVQLLLVDLCSAILVAKVLPLPTITFSGVLKPVVEGRGTLEQVVHLALRGVTGTRVGAVVMETLGASAATARGEVRAASGGPGPAAAGGARTAAPPAATDGGDDADAEVGYDTDVSSRALSDDDEEDGFPPDDGADGDEAADDEPVTDPAATRVEAFLLRFKHCLHEVYQYLSDAAGQEDRWADERDRAIRAFRPLESTIPSVEEALAAVRRREARSQAVTVRRRSPAPGRPGTASSSSTSMGAALSAGSGSANATPAGAALGGAGGSAPISASGPPTRPEAPPPPRLTGPGPAVAPPAASWARPSLVQRAVEVAAADMVEPERISLQEVGTRAQEFARTLATLQTQDQSAWSLFLDPGLQLPDPRALARQLGTSDTPLATAHRALRLLCTLKSLRTLVHVSEQQVARERSLMVDVSNFVHVVGGERVFDADSRQLSPVRRLLDHATGALYRLEALRVNQLFWRDHADDYTADAVTAYCEDALRLVTDLWNPDLRRVVRQQADQDTAAMLELFSAERFVEQLVAATQSFVHELQEARATVNVAALRTAMAQKPLVLPAPDGPLLPPTEVPPELLVSMNLGEVLDEVSRDVTTRVWPLLTPAHQPVETVRRLQRLLRESLAAALVLSPERRRHHETPHLAMAVAGLEKITGNSSLAGHYVRLGDDGRVAYLTDFEDGSYVDVFELRERYFQRPVAGSEPEAGDPDDGEAPVEGERPRRRLYLFTVGRTNRLFVGTPSDLINGCIRGTGGGPRIYPRIVGSKLP